MGRSGDGQVRRRRLEDALALAAGVARANMADHLQTRRDFLQHLGDVFAQARQFGTVAWLANTNDLGFMHHGLARQVRWQRFSEGRFARFSWDGLFRLCEGILRPLLGAAFFEIFQT